MKLLALRLYNEMDDEFLKTTIIDRFEGYELVELLNIPIEEIVEAFQDRIFSERDFLENYLNYGR